MKKYIHVQADFLPNGRILPRRLLWEDDQYFDIDKILEIRRAASLKSGGLGLRYTCRISGQERFLYLDEQNRWFVDTK